MNIYVVALLAGVEAAAVAASALGVETGTLAVAFAETGNASSSAPAAAPPRRAHSAVFEVLLRLSEIVAVPGSVCSSCCG